MPISTSRRLAAGTLSLALAGSFLTAATATTAQASSAAPAPTTKVWITKYRNIEMPDQIRPGVHRFVVRSAKNSGFQILKPRKGYTKRELSEDVASFSVRAVRRLERNTVFMGGVNSSKGEPGVMWTRLPRGRYWVVDTFGERTPPRKVDDLWVRGARHRGVLPGAATIRSTGDAAWAPRPKVMPASGIVTFRNPSDANHFLGAAKLLPGKTVADFEEWVEQSMEGNEVPAPVDWETGMESGVVGPDRAMSLKYDLPPGRYVLVCWWPDADMGNMPHVFMGMYRGITLR